MLSGIPCEVGHRGPVQDSLIEGILPLFDEVQCARPNPLPCRYSSTPSRVGTPVLASLLPCALPLDCNRRFATRRRRGGDALRLNPIRGLEEDSSDGHRARAGRQLWMDIM